MWLYLSIIQEVDLHKKRTGHEDFVDKTLEEAKPIDLESKPKPETDVDMETAGEESSKSQG
jgi:hypothetical protein